MITETTTMLEPVERTYADLARGFSYPDPAFWDAAEGKSLRDLVSGCEENADLRSAADAIVPRRTQEQREADFLATFDHGGIPLYEGLCRGAEGRFGIQEDVLRFYHFFEVRLSEADRDYPDHFVTEIEFMRYLVALEAAAPTEGSALALRRAQTDFLERHVTSWAAKLPALMAERGGADAYVLLALWANAFVRAHLEYLKTQLLDA